MVRVGSLLEKALMKTNMTIRRFAILLVCLNAFWSTSALAQPAPSGVVRVTAQVLNVRAGSGAKLPNYHESGTRRNFEGNWVSLRLASRAQAGGCFGVGKFGGYGAHRLIQVFHGKAAPEGELRRYVPSFFG